VADLDEALELIRALPRHLLRADLAWYWQARATAAQPPAWLRQLADGDTQAREDRQGHPRPSQPRDRQMKRLAGRTRIARPARPACPA
jgi:hypothetical protein